MTAAATTPLRAARQAFHRRAAVPEHERRSRTGVLHRRHHRRHHHRAVALPLALRDRPQLVVLLQGQVARHPAGRPRTRRPLCAGGQHPQVVESNSCDRPVDRHADRQPHLGGALRPRAGGHLRGTGGSDASHRGRDCATDRSRRSNRRRLDDAPTISVPTKSPFWRGRMRGRDRTRRIEHFSIRRFARRETRWRSTRGACWPCIQLPMLTESPCSF